MSGFYDLPSHFALHGEAGHIIMDSWWDAMTVGLNCTDGVGSLGAIPGELNDRCSCSPMSILNCRSD
jgi:hypothetical protein